MLLKLIKYLSNSGSKNALFELFLARAKNELNMASSRFNLPLASVVKSSVTWKWLFSVSFADNVTDILLFGFKPVFRYEIFQKWIIDFVDGHIRSSDSDRYVVPKTVWILGPVRCTDFCLNLKLVDSNRRFLTRSGFSTLKICGPNSEPRGKKYPDREPDRNPDHGSDQIKFRTTVHTDPDWLSGYPWLYPHISPNS